MSDKKADDAKPAPEPKDGKADESKKEGGGIDDQALETCLNSACLSVGIGLIGGFLGSILVRKRWPIVVGLGFGAGQSIGSCREEFKGDEEEKDKSKDGKDKGKSKEGADGKENTM